MVSTANLHPYNKALQDKAAKKAAKANGGKPKWAMTEDAAETAQEAEEAELLDFVDNLDYDKYVGEMDEQDLKAAITALDDAIAESEKAAEGGEVAGSKVRRRCKLDPGLTSA